MDSVIQEGLAPLFERAEREGLWFFSAYQHLWFSPKELRDEQASGRFRWGAVNWELRDPGEYVAMLQKEVDEANRHLSAVIARVQS